MTALGLDGAQMLTSPLNADIDQAIILVAIACSNFGHYADNSEEAWRIAEGDDRIEERLRRPISVGALSRALSLPFETTRRRCASLEAAGLLLRSQSGLIVPPAVMAGPAVRDPWLQCRSALLETTGFLQNVGVDLVCLVGGRAPGRSLSPMLQAKIILNAAQRAAEYWRQPWNGQVGAYIIHGVLDINVGWLDTPPNDPLRYAYFDTPPPDILRRPASIAGLAKRLSLAVSTTRRRVLRLTSEGWLTESDGGYIVTAQTLFDPRFNHNVQEFMQHSVRMLADLSHAGAFP